MSQMLMIGNRFLLCRAGLVARGGRMLVQQQTGQQLQSRSSSSTLQKEAAKFFERHAKRGSPQSPYMLGTTYKIQVTSLLSITHRLTGLALGLVIYGIGAAELGFPKLSFEQILAKVKDTVPEFAITFFKFLTASSFTFHALNGIRHLAWDAGYGFALKNLYMSGYAVMAITLAGMAHLVWNYFQ